MRLRVLASGSSANGYVLYNDKEALVIECGVQYASCLKGIDYRREKIVGALVSHAHGDHSKYVSQYINAAIPVYMSKGTSESIKLNDGERPVVFERFKSFDIGNFKVFPFDTQHDCAEPCGFLIFHPEMGSCLFATDTCYLKYKFEGLSHILIECNYCTTLIDANVENGVIPMFVKNRTLRTHMSLETCVATLKANKAYKANNVVLVHLSSQNSNSDMFRDVVQKEVGVICHIARAGLDIPFDNEL